MSRNTSAGDINSGAAAANSLNELILRSLASTGVYGDQWLTRSELRQVNQWIKTYEYPLFLQLHGDDENGEETGFHLVQNDGADTQYFGRNLINTVADGIYHIGFQIDNENFENEDGDTNASLSDVSAWLNYFLGNRRVTFATWNADVFIGNQESEQVVAYGGNDSIEGGGGNDLLDGSWGLDTLRGGAGNDILDGSFDNDLLDGGQDSDTYLVSGTHAGGWSSFYGFDTYADSGTTGNDRIVAEGVGPVDIGFNSFSTASGIEQIINSTRRADGSAGNAQVRLLGDWSANSFDFSSVAFIGSNILIDGGDGNDTIQGSALADRLRGGRDTDVLTGGSGADTFDYTNMNEALWNGWSSFERITDFVVGVDTMDVNSIPATIQTLGSTTALTTVAIGNLLNSATFAANNVATFTYNNAATIRSFIAFNDATAGFNSCTDALVEISGFSYGAGASSLNQITLV